MPIITVQMLAGRTPEQKRDVVRALTDAVVTALDVDPAIVQVRLQETAPEDVAIGGQLVADRSGTAG